MKVQALHEAKTNFKWDFLQAPEDLGCVYDMHEAHKAFKPFVRVKLQEHNQLNEATYKEIASAIDPNFLNQRVRANALSGIRFVGFSDSNIMNFSVNSSKFSENRIRYVNSVLFEQWEEVGADPDFNFMERARLLLWASDIRLHCTCPSFLYWGYQYILTVLDAAIYPEERFPNIRNPGERGVVCKHMNRILRVLPFHSTEIASELKNQFG